MPEGETDILNSIFLVVHLFVVMRGKGATVFDPDRREEPQ
jgi:hypothetical protein